MPTVHSVAPRLQTRISVISALLTMSMLTSAHAQTPEGAADTLTLSNQREIKFLGVQAVHDNDGWVTNPFSSTDRHYTAGSRLDFFLQGGAFDTVGEWLPFTNHFNDIDYAGGIGISQLIFTSKDRNDPDPPLDERPYAGSLMLHVYVQRFDDKTMDHVELGAGVVGPSSLAEPTQKIFHDVEGWDTQLNDEPVIDLTVRKTWKIGLFDTTESRHGVEGWGMELLPQVGGSLGTVYRQAHAQFTLRGGYNLPGDFGPRRVFDIGSAAQETAERWGVYGFVRGQLRGVQHNIFLDGNTYRSSRSVDKENLVGEFEFGFATRINRHVQVGWSWTALSDEYTTDGVNDAYASIYATVHFDF